MCESLLEQKYVLTCPQWVWRTSYVTSKSCSVAWNSPGESSVSNTTAHSKISSAGMNHDSTSCRKMHASPRWAHTCSDCPPISCVAAQQFSVQINKNYSDALQDAFEDVVTFFGESFKTMPPSVFFPVFVRFIKAYRVSKHVRLHPFIRLAV